MFIEAKDITLDKNKKSTIFKNDVRVRTLDKEITSQFAKYNKSTQEIILKTKITAIDEFENKVETDYAEYNNLKDILKTIGPTTLTTSENYILNGSDLYFDNLNKKIRSEKSAILEDLSGNKIYLENFEYLAENDIFKSIGLIKIIDEFENTYEFSQIYIDTKKKELLGTDIKAFLNNADFKMNKSNDPRIFANTMTLNNEGSSFNKSIFTLCEIKEGEKCPPWSLQSTKMRHDNKSKTIFYENTVIKIYDIPIFYLPRLSHPDPSVDRRSGLLPPLFSDSRNLGASVDIPYFWAISDDKNFTITNKIFFSFLR